MSTLVDQRPLSALIVGAIALLAVVALLGVNVAWTIQFWSEGQHAFIYQVFGISMLVFELVSLVAIAELRAAGFHARANVWTAVFAVTLTFNVITDFSAIITRSSHEMEARARAGAEYDGAATRIGELQRQEQFYLGQLNAIGGDRPVGSYRATLEAIEAQRDNYLRTGRTVPRRISDRVSAAESDLAIAEALATTRTELSQSRAVLTRYGRRPSMLPQYEGGARFLTSLNLRTDAETVEVWFSVLMAIIVKAVVVIGPWAFLVLFNRTRDPTFEPAMDNEQHEIIPTPAPRTASVRSKKDVFDEFEAEAL